MGREKKRKGGGKRGFGITPNKKFLTKIPYTQWNVVGNKGKVYKDKKKRRTLRGEPRVQYGEEK